MPVVRLRDVDMIGIVQATPGDDRVAAVSTPRLAL
jgi:hypothetical protein